VFLTACQGNVSEVHNTSAGAGEVVQRRFRAFLQGDFSLPDDRTTLYKVHSAVESSSTGQHVPMAILNRHAARLAEMGSEAVQPLLGWARHADNAIREIAMQALERITGIKRESYVHDYDRERIRADIRRWSEWLAAHE
jgi:hypothetical protein